MKKHKMTFPKNSLLILFFLSILHSYGATPLESGNIINFKEKIDPALLKEEKSTISILNEKGAQLIKVDYTHENQYPGVTFTTPTKEWDFTGYIGIDAEVKNEGTAAVQVALRADNRAGGKEPWNTSADKIEPGETKTIRLIFGKEINLLHHVAKAQVKMGFPLDTAHISSMRLFAVKPKENGVLKITSLRATKEPLVLAAAPPTDKKSEPQSPTEPVKSEKKHKKESKDSLQKFSEETARTVPVKIPEWVGKRPPVEGEWVQTLNENFDVPILDPKLWTPRQCYNTVIHNHFQRYVEENVLLKDGIASIKCEKLVGTQYNDPALDRREYTTACFTSYGKWTQLYGYIEARVKSPTAKGFWACFWMMPDRGGEGKQKERAATHNGGMEVDIQEQLTNWGPGRYNIALHWDGYKEDHKHVGSSKNYYGPTEDHWHVFGVLWEPGKYTFYCDGVKIAEWTNERVGSVPAFILCNVEMRGESLTEIEDKKLPDYYQIDYVKAWQLKSRIQK